MSFRLAITSWDDYKLWKRFYQHWAFMGLRKTWKSIKASVRQVPPGITMHSSTSNNHNPLCQLMIIANPPSSSFFIKKKPLPCFVWLWAAVHFDINSTHHCYFCCGMKTYFTWACSRSYSMSPTWTEFFFHGCPPHLVELYQETPQDYDALQQFECNGSWSLGEPLRTNMPPGHMIMVLPLTVRKEKSRIQYVAKTVSGPDHYLVSSLISLKVSGFPIETAEAHIRMTGLKNRNYKPAEVQRQLDPFLVEARAFEHIKRHCPDSYKNFFLQYFGVFTGIPRKKYPSSCVLRQRAVVLEMIYPDLASRRVLAAETHCMDDLTNSLHQDLQEKGISSFEINWYKSLFSDWLRRITALHVIGLTHGDIRDDHFRLPNDFYDTVLYDFSASYTFSPSMPCRRRLRPLSVLQNIEKEMLFRIILERSVCAPSVIFNQS